MQNAEGCSRKEDEHEKPALSTDEADVSFRKKNSKVDDSSDKEYIKKLL